MRFSCVGFDQLDCSKKFFNEKSPIENVSFFLPCNTCMFAFYTRDVHSSEVADIDSDLSLLNICLHVVLSNVYGRGL